MSLRATGRIVSSDISCVKCSTGIRVAGKPDDLFCGTCGAYYKLIKAEIVENEIELEYDSMGFVCMYATYNSNCRNTCPSENMYCKEHSSDKAVEAAKRDLDYAENNIKNLKDKLTRIEQSKANWFILELSGIDQGEQ